jgi:hypothetical protein
MTTVDDVLGKLQVWSGAQLFIRFYGRFVFVFAGSELRVLAVDVRRDRSQNAGREDCHIPFMTVREKNVGLHTVQPSSRIMGTEVAPFEGALNVWNLNQRIIDIKSSGSVNWPDKNVIPLKDLKHLSGSEIDDAYLQPHPSMVPNTAVTAIIDIHSGYSFSFHLPSKEANPLDTLYDIVTVGNQHDPVPGECPQRLADMVQITMPLPPDGVALTLDDNNSSTKPSASDITINPATDRAVVLSFSNLCSANLEAGPDLEFAQFYDVLKNPPDDYNDRRIPRLTTPISRAARQETSPLTNTSPRFGDCFLGAMISAPPIPK